MFFNNFSISIPLFSSLESKIYYLHKQLSCSFMELKSSSKLGALTKNFYIEPALKQETL